jgi:hypothetical protein
MEAIDIFELTDDDYYAVEIARKVAYSLLRHPKINPKQVIGLGAVLFALERLPKVTKGLYCEFRIVLREGTEEFNEMKYISFEISDCSFGISQGGSVYDIAVGGDSYSIADWRIEVGGYRETDCDLLNLEDTIEEYLSLGAEINIDFEPDIFGMDE